MSDPERQTRSHLMKLFERHGIRPRFELGQNFLIDLNIIEFVVRSAELGPQDVVLEIGTGTAGMTTFMAKEAGHVVTVDVDRNMHRLALDVLSPYTNVTMVTRDALAGKHHFAPEVLDALRSQLTAIPGSRLKLVANLPYSIATPVITNLVSSDLPWERMVVTIQYEVGLRLQAQAGTEFYGAVSAWLQSQCRVELLKKLGPTVFWPRPKVDSAVMLLTPDPQAKARINDCEFFHDYLRRVFNQRRKLLRGVLASMYEGLSKSDVEALLAELGLIETARAEELSVATHIQLANRLQLIQACG